MISTDIFFSALVLCFPILAKSFCLSQLKYQLRNIEKGDDSMNTMMMQPPSDVVRSNTHFRSCLHLTGGAADGNENSNNIDDGDGDGDGNGNGNGDGDDLTKYEFGLRLKEVRDYYRETNEMSQENVCLTLFRTRLPNLRLNRCCVGAESTIPGAGRGLFASRDIEEGELITLYPGDVMFAWETSVGDFSGQVSVMVGNHVQQEDHQAVANRLTTDSARSYELKIGGRHSVVADPLLTDDAAYLGHLANDAAIVSRRDEEAINAYVEISEKGQNAANFVLEGSHFVTVATNNIAKGEEIFVSYGYSYWFSRSGDSTTNMTTLTAEDSYSKPSSSDISVYDTSQSVAKKGSKISKKRGQRKKGFGKN